MRRWRNLLVVLVMSTLGVLVYPASPACACSCAELSLAEAVDNAHAVFLGRVVRLKDPPLAPIMSSADPLTATFEVSRVYKGQVGSRVLVQTAMSGASCGAELVEGHEYVLFARTEGDHLTTNLCAGNRDVTAGGTPLSGGSPIDGASPIAGASPNAAGSPLGSASPLGVGYPPGPERADLPADGWAWWWALPVGVGLAVAGLGVWRLRRRAAGPLTAQGGESRPSTSDSA